MELKQKPIKSHFRDLGKKLFQMQTDGELFIRESKGLYGLKIASHPRRRLTTHSTGRAISKPLIESLDGFGGLCAPVNSGVRPLLSAKEIVAK